MVISTTPTIEGRPILEYKGLVTGETIIGSNPVKDVKAMFTDFFGGRSKAYEELLRKAKDSAITEMEERAKVLGANAIVGIEMDYEAIGESGTLLMVSCCGTAVVI